MAHTDRDDERWFWNDHFRWNKGNSKCEDHCYHRRRDGGRCWHHNLPDAEFWANPYRHEMGVPSWWKRDQRREERGKARNMMARTRSGHIEWDNLIIDYKRPWYW